MHDVGGEQKQLKKGNVGFPGIAGNLGQRIIVEEFAVVLFDGGSRIVEQIHPPGRHFEIGHKGVINVFGILEQFELFVFLRVFGDWPTHHDKTMQALGVLIQVPEEFADFPTVVEFLESTPSHLGFDVGIFFGDDHVSAAALVEELDDSGTIKSGIHAESNANSGDIHWDFGQANFQERHRAGRRTGVAWTQCSMPEFLSMSLETKQRMIRSSSRLFGIVPDASAFLFAIDRDHHRIDIEGQAGSFVGQSPQIRAQTVVHSDQLPNRLRTQSLQKSSQGRLIREPTQSQNLQEESVVLQNLGLVDALESHDNRVEQGQDQFGRMILRLIVRIMPIQTLLNLLFEIDLLAKTVNQQHSSEVSQVTSLEENLDISGSFGHGMQTSHLVYFLSQKYFAAYYTLASSIKSIPQK